MNRLKKLNDDTQQQLEKEQEEEKKRKEQKEKRDQEKKTGKEQKEGRDAKNTVAKDGVKEKKGDRPAKKAETTAAGAEKKVSKK